MNTGRVGPIELARSQRLEQPVLERQLEREVERRMLGLGVDADRASARAADSALDQLENLFERRNLEAAVVLLRARRIRLHRAQLLDLGEREVAGEEAGDRLAVEHLGAAAIRELAARDFTSVVSSSSGSCRAIR